MTFSPVARYVAPAVLILAAGTALVSVSNYSNAQSQPGTPSQTQPDRNQRDQNQRDQNQRDQNRPGTNQPGTPSDTDNTRRDNRDDNRDNVDRSNMQPEDDDFFWRDDANRDDQNRQGYTSPFTFMSPQSRTGFDTRTQRLARMEDRLTQRSDELIRRLGEVRQLSPERRDDAMMDLMQQILLDQRRLMLYLKQSRTTWSGETMSTSATGEERMTPGMNPNSPNSNPNNTPGTNPSNPTNPGNNPRSPR